MSPSTARATREIALPVSGLTTLREAGLKLIFDGVTTIDEVVRETVMEDVE